MSHTSISKAKAEPDPVAAPVRGLVRAAKRRARRSNGEDEEVFQLLSEEELLALPPPEPLIDGGLLTVGAFTVLYGPPSTFKTFVAVHFGCCVATGLKCFERTVKKGPVLFIAAEGVGGLGKRVRAWRKVNKVKGAIDITFLPEAVNLLDQGSEGAVQKLIATIQALPRPPELIIVDTLARCLIGGDENTARDVGLAVAALDRVRRVFGSCILLVHHTVKRENEQEAGKKKASRVASVERGSSALRGAADSMISIAKSDDGITLKCAKPPKDGPAFPTVTLKLVPVQLEEIDESCVLERVPTLALPLRDQFRSKGTFAVLDLLVQRQDGARFAEMEGQLFAKGKGLKKRSFARALGRLCKMEYVAKVKLPNEAGSGYAATEAGRAVHPKIAAIRRRQ